MALRRTGVAYFGNRTIRHVRADMIDIRQSGFDYVVHCMTESDLIWGLESMRAVVEVSKEAGLEVHLDPWGLAGIFGGEALSKFVAWEPQTLQVMADGTLAAGCACLWAPELRAFIREWTDAAIDIGADQLFWDEPHWYPGDLWYYGKERGDQTYRWSCRCKTCLERFEATYGFEMPFTFTREVELFRQSAVYDILVDIFRYASNRGVDNGLCLLPHGQYYHLVNLPDWEPFVQIPGVDVFGTDPYWRVNPPLELEPYCRPNARHSRELCDRYGKRDQYWLQGYGFPKGAEHEAVQAIDIAIEEGLTDIGVWAYRACESMSRLWPGDIDATWSTIVNALNERKVTGK